VRLRELRLEFTPSPDQQLELRRFPLDHPMSFDRAL
jgi:hypothetical protein